MKLIHFVWFHLCKFQVIFVVSTPMPAYITYCFYYIFSGQTWATQGEGRVEVQEIEMGRSGRERTWSSRSAEKLFLTIFIFEPIKASTKQPPDGICSGLVMPYGIWEHSQHWFRKWLVACSVPSHYQNQWQVLRLSWKVSGSDHNFVKSSWSSPKVTGLGLKDHLSL